MVRIGGLTALAATAALLAVGGSTTAAAPPAPAAVFRLVPDTRMCPSPSCGGFWASRVNRGATVCRGGASRRSCYVARVDLAALAGPARARVQATLGTGRALVAGAFATAGSSRFTELAVTAAWLATEADAGTGTVVLIADTGIRCIRAPCFSLRGTTVNRSGSFVVSGLDLTRAGAGPAEIAAAHAALAHGGLLAVGSVQDAAKPAGGRTFVATQLWLPAF